MRRSKIPASLSILALAAGTWNEAAHAELKRIDVADVSLQRPPPDANNVYELVTGTFHGELDPKAAANSIITDIKKAARNARGMVEYSANFSILRPLGEGSGVLHYYVPNRGGMPMGSDDDGHYYVSSGWQGDITQDKNRYWAKVPVAKGVSGKILVRMVKVAADAKSISVNSGITSMSPRPVPVSLDTKKAKLVIERKGQADVSVAPADWAFADCEKVAFPGTPDPAKICLKDAVDPDAAYRLSYTAKDPPVLGIGWAMTRDLIAFLRSGEPDSAGNKNPLAGKVRWAVGVGDSQSGNFLRSFVHLGFNRDEQGKRVFDGINPNIAARQLVLNLRFGAPSGAAGTYEPGSEGALWWGRYEDKARKQGVTSLLDRCTKTNSCPKIIETFGSAEFWGLRASPGLVGTDAKADIPLPANVRRYYFPSITHGGSFRGGFPVNGEAQFMGATCMLAGNPNPSREQMRVARKALVGWVKNGAEPPASRYPTIALGDLVEPTGAAMGWPGIPGAPTPDGHINPLYDYDFGKGFMPRDVSGLMTGELPRVKGVIRQLVPRVNADGNEWSDGPTAKLSGVPSVHLQVPLGTYTGWNAETKGYHSGENCGFAGGFIPFARTKAEREAKGDPRLSLEERYGDYAGFVAKVRLVAAQEVADGWLMPDDAARIIAEAEASAVLK
jgi:Alpha/beta hydrolase domain